MVMKLALSHSLFLAEIMNQSELSFRILDEALAKAKEAVKRDIT